MKVLQQIESKIRARFRPVFMDIADESAMHHVGPDAQTHFKILVVSERFHGKPLLERHREIYTLLKKELQENIHALSLVTHSPEEWARTQKNIAASPQCLGSSFL